jgi:hypothetical protein
MTSDPLVTLCAQWHALAAEMSAAYKAIDLVPRDEQNRAYDKANKLCKRVDDLFDRIAPIAPSSIAGLVAQATVAKTVMVTDYSSETESTKEEPHFTDDAMRGIYRVLANIAAFKAGTAAG